MRRDRQTPKLHRSERAEKICVTPRVCQARSRTVRPGAMTGCGKPPRSVWNVRRQKCVGTATTIRHTPNRNHTNHNIDAIILTISSNRGPKSPRLSGVEQNPLRVMASGTTSRFTVCVCWQPFYAGWQAAANERHMAQCLASPIAGCVSALSSQPAGKPLEMTCTRYS
jgi:hypothetical protein